MAEQQPAVPEPTGSTPPPAEAAPAAATEPAAAQAAPVAQTSVAAATASEPPAAAPETAPVAGASQVTDANEQAAIDELLKQANFEDAGGPAPAAEAAPAPDTAPFELPSFQQVMQDAQASSIELLRDVELNVKIELGRSRMLVEDVLKLSEGSVVELDKLAGDPVDVFVNERLVARGEVLVLNDNFCVRVNEIVAGLKEEGL
jgi:flagellar motor switch protein FliN/FliY